MNWFCINLRFSIKEQGRSHHINLIHWIDTPSIITHTQSHTHTPTHTHTHTHVILEFSTEQQRKAACVTPRLATTVSVKPLFQSEEFKMWHDLCGESSAGDGRIWACLIYSNKPKSYFQVSFSFIKLTLA